PGGLDLLPRGIGAERLGDVVAWRKPCEEHRRGRDSENEHDGKRDAPRDVRDHRAVTVSVSGDHRSRGGTCSPGAGVTLPTRAELATNTRDAANAIVGWCSTKIFWTSSNMRLRVAAASGSVRRPNR